MHTPAITLGASGLPPVCAAADRPTMIERFLRARRRPLFFYLQREVATLVADLAGRRYRTCGMGIEKVIPSWTDLGVFLQLLPRSATGERMNPYTSMWTGVTPGDGPQAFHLVLLDNGRTAALADSVGRPALACIRCSACLNVCPVYERVGGHAYGSVYPGPIGAVLTPQLVGVGTSEHADSLPFASTLCGA